MYIKTCYRKALKIGLAAAMLAASAAQAGPFQCLPSNLLGDGSAVFTNRNPKGNFAAWRCPSGNLQMIVCLKSECDKAGVEAAVSAFINRPDVSALNQEATKRNPWTDPALKVVWQPYKAQILAIPTPSAK